jgi:DtxR family Mn-dependent transcriptional regulator
VTLADLPAGVPSRVVRVSDEDGERLRYLAELGIGLGAEVEILSRAPYGGPLTLRVDGEERRIGPELASQILVEPRSAA